MTKGISQDSLKEAMELFTAGTPPVPEGKERKLVLVTHPDYVAKVEALMEEGKTMIEAMMIVPPRPGSLRMMLVDKEKP